MQAAFLVLLWLAALAAALSASEILVRAVSAFGREHGLSGLHLGILVALGADGPEVTSALIATTSGAGGIGLGVVTGSNIYNLAGLLGLAAILSAGLSSDRIALVRDGGANLALTVALVVLLQIPGAHRPLSIVLLALLGLYVGIASLPRKHLAALFPADWRPPLGTHPDETASIPHPVPAAAAGVVAIIAASDLIVRTSILLTPLLHIPVPVLANFILPIATSLPNTWAAVSLARKRMAAAAVAATFNSNSINIALGVGIPGLLVATRVSHAARTLDAGWLLLMTVAALALLAAGRKLSTRDGVILVALYLVYAVLRLTVF